MENNNFILGIIAGVFSTVLIVIIWATIVVAIINIGVFLAPILFVFGLGYIIYRLIIER
jgi:hypothetical protein